MKRREISAVGLEEPVPQFIGPYSVMSRLSNHKATAVFRAYDGAHRRDVAIKMLTKPGSMSASSRAAMEREAHYAQLFVHPGLVELYAYVATQPRHYFAMEYFAPGATLATTHLSGESPFPASPLKPLLIQVIETLGYIHSQGVVHRDIKPDNILVNEHACTKLIDLSVAFERKLPTWKRLLGMRHKVVGTRTYMSPEQIEGRDVDGRADLYSFGVMMFELLAGRAPFVADRPDALLRMHLTSQPQLLHLIRPDVTHEASQLVSRLMSKDPGQRPQKADDVLYQLHRIKLKAADKE